MTKKTAILVASFFFHILSPLSGSAAEAAVEQSASTTHHPLEPVLYSDLHRAKVLLPQRSEKSITSAQSRKAWNFEDGSMEGFVNFSGGVLNPKVENGVLKFVAGEESVTLGWGNYKGQNAGKGEFLLWPGWNQIRFRVRQSGGDGQSHWTINLWEDGWACTEEQRRTPPQRSRIGNMEPKGFATLRGEGWQELSFDVGLRQPDGFELTIDAVPGTVIEIDAFDSLVVAHEGMYRLAFDIPEGEIWRAPVSVLEGNRMWVNGEELPREGYPDVHANFFSIDIAPYLRPGRNVLVTAMSSQPPPNAPALIPRRGQPRGFSAARVPESYVEGSVVMQDGRQISLDTDERWRTGSGEISEVGRPDFDDATWGEATVATKAPGIRPSLIVHRSWARTVYDGPIHLLNPADPKFFFNDQAPVLVQVDIPAGLSGESYYLTWTLFSSDRKGVERPIAGGRVDDAVVAGQSQRFQLEAGKHARGVYTLSVALHDGEEVVARHPREPLVITGRIPMRETPGRSLKEEMDLVLEDRIDFTDTSDSRLRMESVSNPGRRDHTEEPTRGVDQPVIRKENGLVYRETQPGRGSMFSYTFEFEKPGEFYLLELDYPDNAERAMAMAVSDPSASGSALTVIGPGVLTGWKFPHSGKMETLHAIMVGKPGTMTLDVVNLHEFQPAAASRLSLYRIKDLPALETGQDRGRMTGLHTERSYPFATPFTSFSPDEQETAPTGRENDMLQRQLVMLHWYLEASENYTRYLRFTGQNLHVMGMFQYTKNNMGSYARHPLIHNVEIPSFIGEVALRVFGDNGIAMMSMVEYSRSLLLDGEFNTDNRAVGRGEDTLFSVSRDGEQGRWMHNFNHARVEEDYLRLIDDLGRSFGHHPAWKGVFVMAVPGFSGPAHYTNLSFTSAGPAFDFCYSDATIERFAKDTGIKVPGKPGDPARFGQRHAFLTAEENLGQWEEWRIRRIVELLRRTVETLQKYRPDLEVFYGEYLVPGMIFSWAESGDSFQDFFRKFGFDPSALQELHGVSAGRYLYPNDRNLPLLVGRRDDMDVFPHLWDLAFAPDAIAAYEGQSHRFTVQNTGWHEYSTYAPGVYGNQGDQGKPVPSEWPWRFNRSRFISQRTGDFAREMFAASMIGADAQTLIFGFTDAVILNGNEQALRTFTRAFRPLPTDKFLDYDSTCDFRHNLAIRHATVDGELWFYAVNPGFWNLRAVIELEGDVKVADPATGERVSSRLENGRTVLDFELPPYGMAAFRAAADASIAGWSNQPIAAEDLAFLGRMADRLDAAADDSKHSRESAEFAKKTTREAREAIDRAEYARAWALLTNSRAWRMQRE